MSTTTQAWLTTAIEDPNYQSCLQGLFGKLGALQRWWWWWCRWCMYWRTLIIIDVVQHKRIQYITPTFTPFMISQLCRLSGRSQPTTVVVTNTDSVLPVRRSRRSASRKTLSDLTPANRFSSMTFFQHVIAFVFSGSSMEQRDQNANQGNIYFWRHLAWGQHQLSSHHCHIGTKCIIVALAMLVTIHYDYQPLPLFCLTTLINS